MARTRRADLCDSSVAEIPAESTGTGVALDGGERADVAACGEPEPQGFFETMHRLPDADWQSHVVYIYRLEPPIKNTGDRNFIEKRTTPFDESDILANHGSGRYMLLLNNTRRKETISKATVNVYHPDHPPRIRAAQLAPHADEEWRTWIEESERQRVIAQSSSAPLATAPASLSAGESAGIRELAEVSKRVLEMLATSNSANVHQPPAPADGVLKLVADMATGRDLLAQKLAEQASKPHEQPDPIAALERAAGIIERFRPAHANRADRGRPHGYSNQNN